MGDSITDPNCYGDKIKKYWDFLQEWLTRHIMDQDKKIGKFMELKILRPISGE